MSDSKDVHKKIRALRLKLRLTREQVCSLLACSLEFYGGLEEGRYEPDDDTISDFINLYGVDRTYFYPKSKEGKIKKFDIVKE